ncbi:hypothetical protein CFC21_009471 [Triticum aestivum]|uniref:Uncharacterized protein n=2 Tax=Triticum aestivum TaxID=4565 RepID=A0A3B5Z6Z0_WHEAT|nr:disease resistance protein RGA5-like [Triticum aestivum]KAF6992486.1 hypothetical protein CFC21_009471 [Triticum aestivum]
MAGGIVTVASGVMSPLIGKLTALMGDEYNKFKGVRKQASFLQKELSAMNAALQKLELMDEDLDPTVKDWRDHVREMSYNMENCIDDFIRQSQAGDAKVGFIKKTARHIKKLRWRLRIADQMEELKNLAIEANARRQRYKIDDWKPSSSSVVVDPRIPALYQEASTLVGIDGPREEVATLLLDSRKDVKVVSIVGFGGLGKTTLAKEVYYKIGSQFDCKACISVSQRPDMTDLLMNLQKKLGMKDPKSSRAAGKVDDIIEELRKHLKKKRYLIVVDDVWDVSAWNIIKCAFPEDGNGSRVLVTTRLERVAGTACQNDRGGIYKLEPLSEENSKMLLLKRVFGSGHGCPPQLEELMAEILRKCHGLPLAVITISSLLANEGKSRKGWESIRDSLGVQSATNPTMEQMNDILNLSYMHLPAHLRACFLYFGMYPEDSLILRDDLIRQWVAESFISNLYVQDQEDIGMSYFNELVNRSMVQQFELDNGQVVCSVHDMLLDLILSKCAQDNFASVAYSYQDMTKLHGREYKIRRLSLSSMAGCRATYGSDIVVSMSQVRSFTLLRNSMPNLLLFKYVRVLRIRQDHGDEESLDLTAIGQLFQLRYLYVSGPYVIHLPAELHRLVYLETLDIRRTRCMSIPSDMVHMPRLFYLGIKIGDMLPEWIGNMKSLRSLEIWPDYKSKERNLNVMKGIIGLGMLTDLRELTIDVRSLEKSEVDALASSIGKLCNLNYIRFSGRCIEGSRLGSLSNPFRQIEEFHGVIWYFPRVPIWMCGLYCLRILELQVEETSTEEVQLLGELPSLVQFSFRSSRIPKKRAMLGTRLFPIVEHFEFQSEEDVMVYLGFEAGAMPNLRTLGLGDKKWDGNIPVGLEHLLCLEKIQLHGPNSGDDAIVSAFRDALSVQPNHPSIEHWHPEGSAHVMRPAI